MYVCLCKAVTDKEIRRAATRGTDNLYELQESLGVATCCGSCADEAEAIIAEARPDGGAAPVMYVPSPA